MAYTVDSTPISTTSSSAYAGLTNAFAGIIDAYENPNSKANLQRDALQQSLIDQANTEEQDLYNKINTLPGTPNNTLDKNIKAFFMNKLDKGYQYETARKNGQISSREANMMMSQINTDMDTYTTLAPQILAQAEIMKQAIANGSISRANADPMQMMFMGIAQNAGSIRLEEDEGGMYLVGSGEINGKAWDGKINIKDVQNYLATEGAQIAKTIPTSADMGLSDTFESLKTKGKFNAYMTTKNEPDPNNPGYTRATQEFTPKGVQGIREHLMNNTMLFENLMKSDMGAAAWADVANHNLSAEELNGTSTININGEDVSREGWGKWDPNDQEKVEYMRGKLIDRMLAENLPTKLIGELKADQFALARYKAGLTRTNNMSAGAKQALYRKDKIDSAWRAGDLESLNNLIPGIEVIKQKNGNYLVTETKIVEEDGVQSKQVTNLYNGKINFKDAKGFDEFYDIFEVSKFGTELGLDSEALTGYSPNVYSKNFEGIGARLDNYMEKNPNASVDDILNVKVQTLDKNNKPVDVEGKDIEAALKTAGVTIVNGRFSIDPNETPELAEFRGIQIDNKNIFELIDFISNNQMIVERQKAEKDRVITQNIKNNRPT